MLKLSAHRYLVQFEMPGEHLLETHTPLDQQKSVEQDT